MSLRPSTLIHALLGAASCVLFGAVASATVSLQSFEPLAAGQPPGLPWLAPGTALTVVDQDAAVGGHSLQIPAPTGSVPTEAALFGLVSGHTPGFADLWIKPVSRTLTLHPVGHPAAGQPVETTGVLYLDGAHFLFQRQVNRYALLARTRTADGAARWLRLGGVGGTPVDHEIEDTGGRAKEWIRLTVRRDLAAGTYDVWINQRLVAVDLALHRFPGSPEFRLMHRPTEWPADGPLAAMRLDEVQAGPQHPLYADSDADALPDVWEAAYQAPVDPTRSFTIDAVTPDRYADLDRDSVPKISEYFFGSRPNHADSDGDGLPDAVEIQHGLNPASRLDAGLDKDGDGFSNLAEFQGRGNGDISLPPAGALANVVYVKADHVGLENGQYATPYRSLVAAIGSPFLAAGGRIVIRGEGGPLTHYLADPETSHRNGQLTISKPVTLVGVNMAQIHLQEMASFATVAIPGSSSGPVFTCENIAFECCWGEDGGVLRIVGTPGEVVLRNCRFSSCYASDDGGAIFAHAARLTIEDCWFDHCWSNGEGGALHTEGGTQAFLRRAHFQYTTSDTDGGAVSLRGATAAPILMESCSFLGNAAQRGGALAAVDGADATLRQCTLSGNVARTAGAGGALFGASTGTLFSASGCVFWNNTAGSAAHAHLAGGLSTVTYTSLSGWTSTAGPAGTGNNGSDPLFRAGTLVPTSTAMLDSSNPAHNLIPDFFNNARWDAPGGTTGTLADRGAYERLADSDGDGLSDDWEQRYGFNAADATDADGDADQDGYSNAEEFADKTDPRSPYSSKAPVIFVSPSSGMDWHPGPNPPAGTLTVALQGTRSRPFQSLRRAILACPANRRIVLLDGTYTGPRNTNIKRSESWTWLPHLATTSITSALSLDAKTIRGLNGARRAVLDGGGQSRLFDLDLYANYTAATVVLQNLSLRRGTADLGGAIRAVSVPGQGYLNLQGCELSGNRATAAGGAVYVKGAGLNLSKCSLYANEAPLGGAVAMIDLSPAGTSSLSSAGFTQCRFAYNQAVSVNGTLGQGGAVSVQASTLSTSQTRFDFNHAERDGGGVAVLAASGYYPPSLGTGTVFEGNRADRRGGGLYCENACVMTTGGAFIANHAGTTGTTGEGGAVFLAHPSTTTFTYFSYSSRIHAFNGTQFVRNSAGLRGGALALVDVSPVFTNCALVENSVDPDRGRGGAVAVFWQAGHPLMPESPFHSSAPRFVHATFARNRGSLASNLHADALTTPWLINSTFGDASRAPASPSLLGPRQLHGCQLTAPDSLLTTGESDPARRNLLAAPSFAFDFFHLATPVRLPNDTSSTSGGVEPSAAVSFTRPTSDIDFEPRPPAVAGKFTLMRGCDEPRDTDNDSLPDWFELLAVQFSTLDPITTIAHTHPVTPATPTLPSALPTNNADGDAYTLTQELLHGGRPHATETTFLGRDSDGDGLADIFERLTPGYDWQNPDQDNDGFLDGWEVGNKFSINVVDDPDTDSDLDGLTDHWEQQLRQNPRNRDSDNDGTLDGAEDSDGDGLANQHDAHPRENLIDWPRTTEPRYIVVPLPPSPFGLNKLTVYDMNNKGEVVAFADPPTVDFTRPDYRIPLIWRAGAWHYVGSPTQPGQLQANQSLQWARHDSNTGYRMYDCRFYTTDKTELAFSNRPIQISDDGTVAAHAIIQNNAEDGRIYKQGANPSQNYHARSIVWPGVNGVPDAYPVPLGHDPVWPPTDPKVSKGAFDEDLTLAVLRPDATAWVDGGGPDDNSSSAILSPPYNNLGRRAHPADVFMTLTYAVSRSGVACGRLYQYNYNIDTAVWDTSSAALIRDSFSVPVSIASMPSPDNAPAMGPLAVIDQGGYLSTSNDYNSPIPLHPSLLPYALHYTSTINERGECLWRFAYPDTTRPHLWRNGRLRPLSQSLPGSAWTITRTQDLNDHGAILAYARPATQPLAPEVPVVVFPMGLKAHRRGTFVTPGPEVLAGTGEFGYETVLMENGDSESAADSTQRDCDHPENLSEYRQNHDDDLVKIVLRFPPSMRLPGASLKLVHSGMRVDSTQTTPAQAVTSEGPSNLTFWRADGTRITDPAAELQITDLANPPAGAYLSQILNSGELTLFIEGGNRFGTLPATHMDHLGGALIQLQFKLGDATTTEKLLVYKGGFLRFLQPEGQPGVRGTLEFWDGKGRVRHVWSGFGSEFATDETDYGTLMMSWGAKSGKTVNNRANPGGPYNEGGSFGHIPPGWWRQWPSSLPFTTGQRDTVSVTNGIKKVRQGGYVRWKQDDESDESRRYTKQYRYDAGKPHDRSVGEPNPIMFKYDMLPIRPTRPQGRTALQIHPDGECDDPIMGGTAGCIGIQTYRGCTQLRSVLTRFKQLKVKVELHSQEQ